jgi:hypothetical protein
MDFNGIESHPFFLKTLMGIDQSKHLSNQDEFENGDWVIQICEIFDQTLIV